MKRLKPFIKLPSNRFLTYAIVLSILFACGHMLGLRKYTSILSGTASFSYFNQYGGAIYILLYAWTMLVAPILLLAGFIGEVCCLMINKAMRLK